MGSTTKVPPTKGHQNLYEMNCPKKRKKSMNKFRMARLRLFVTLFLILWFAIPSVLKSGYGYLLINRVKNAHIFIDSSPSLLHSAEKMISNDNFFSDEYVARVDFDNPLMKRPGLGHEMQGLKKRIETMAAPYTYLTPGVFVWDYSTGNYVNINADKEFPTASIIKLPILHQMFRRSEMGYIHLNDKMQLTEYYRSPGSGSLQFKGAGMSLSMQELAQLMIQESDNTATNMILASIGGVEDINRALRLWGFSQSHLSNWLPDLDGTNVSTPYDIGTMLYNIDNPDFHSLESRARMVDIMSHVKNRFLIQASLPPSAAFIHKTGDIGEMLGDAGIVTLADGRKYIIVVMVKRPWNSYAAKQFIIDTSKIVYDAFAYRSF